MAAVLGRPAGVARVEVAVDQRVGQAAVGDSANRWGRPSTSARSRATTSSASRSVRPAAARRRARNRRRQSGAPTASSSPTRSTHAAGGGRAAHDPAQHRRRRPSGPRPRRRRAGSAARRPRSAGYHRRVEPVQHRTLVGEERRHHLEPGGPRRGGQPPDARQVPGADLHGGSGAFAAGRGQRGVGPGEVGCRATGPGVGQAQRVLGERVRAGPWGQLEPKAAGSRPRPGRSPVPRPTGRRRGRQQSQHGDVESVVPARPGDHVGDLLPPGDVDLEGRQGAEQRAVPVTEQQRHLSWRQSRRRHGVSSRAGAAPGSPGLRPARPAPASSCRARAPSPRCRRGCRSRR